MCQHGCNCVSKETLCLMHSSSTSRGLGASSPNGGYSYYYYCYNPRLYSETPRPNGYGNPANMDNRPWWANTGIERDFNISIKNQ